MESETQLNLFRPLRIWPIVVLLAVMAFFKSLPWLITEFTETIGILMVLGAVGVGILLLLFWLSLSRARWKEKLVGLIGVLVVGAITYWLSHPTMQGGPGSMVFAVPTGMAGFGIAAILFSNLLSWKRVVLILLLASIGFGSSLLFRSEGFWGEFGMQLEWRWKPTAEENLLASLDSKPTGEHPWADQAEFEQWISSSQWPGFRGPDRTGTQTRTIVDPNWSTSPKQLWRIDVGPGWSSFAVAGELLFTQEQRGQQETIVCYRADTGDEVWTQEIQARFDDPLGGPGPRATPTLAQGKLFALGARGDLLCLNPAGGSVVWQVDLKAIAEREPATWGFCSSPLVVDSKVIVHAGGESDKGTLAFDIENGDLVWQVASGDHSYSSPQLVSIEGNSIVLMLTNAGLDFISPSDGTLIGNHDWKIGGYRSMQPVLVDPETVLFPSDAGTGTRRIAIELQDGKIATKEVWTSPHLRPDFNDMVVFEGYAYGFNGAIFTCIDLETGERMWKGGRYGKGQVLCLADCNKLLVMSERGDVVLLEANPKAHQELGRFNAFKDKTWNHPVLVGNRLFIRNSKEAACFQLPIRP